MARIVGKLAVAWNLKILSLNVRFLFNPYIAQAHVRAGARSSFIIIVRQTMKPGVPISVLAVLATSACGHYPQPVNSLRDIKTAAATEDMIAVRGLPPADWSALEKFAALEHLRVSRDFAPTITDEHVIALSRGHFPKLRQVSLAYCEKVSDAGFVALGTIKSIEGLQLIHTSISDVGLQSLISALPRLRGLNLIGCELLTKEGILGIATFTGISSIGVSLGRLSQQDIEALIAAMPHVRHWSIKDSDGVLALPRLRVVALRHQTNVTLIDSRDSARSL